MKRSDLEHIIRAAAAITDQYEIMIVSSQSILGAVPDAPPELLLSMEADVYPMQRPELADLIDGAIGELSPFEERFGYYAQGVGPETAILPAGWQGRVVRIQNQNTDFKVGYCLDPADLAASKTCRRARQGPALCGGDAQARDRRSPDRSRARRAVAG